jgi:hypothetical protein
MTVKVALAVSPMGMVCPGVTVTPASAAARLIHVCAVLLSATPSASVVANTREPTMGV